MMSDGPLQVGALGSCPAGPPPRIYTAWLSYDREQKGQRWDGHKDRTGIKKSIPNLYYEESWKAEKELKDECSYGSRSGL
jgi:hypothetical protein